VAHISVEPRIPEDIQLADINTVKATPMTQNSRDSESANEDRASVGIPMKEDKQEPDFVASVGLTSQQAANQLAKFGRNELPEKVIPKVCD